MSASGSAMSLIATMSRSARLWRRRITFLPIRPKPMSPMRVVIIDRFLSASWKLVVIPLGYPNRPRYVRVREG